MQEQYRGVPTSPTGRTPKWVLDEAMGRPTEPVPFRAYTLPGAPARPPAPLHRRLGRIVLVTSLVTAGVVAFGALDARNGGFTPRVLTAQQQAPTPGHEEGEPTAPLGTEADDPQAQGYRFLSHQPDSDQPVTWSPCRPVHYVVRPDHAPAQGATMLAQAIAEVSTATGLRFVADGATGEGPSEERNPYQPDRYGDRWAPVLIAWATHDEVPDFGGEIAGEAGPVTVTTPSGDKAYVSGVVHLDAAELVDIVGTSGVAAATSVVAHELGHLVGLAHVDDPAQLMFPRSGAQAHYAAGDLAGLAALGRGACQPDV